MGTLDTPRETAERVSPETGAGPQGSEELGGLYPRCSPRGDAGLREDTAGLPSGRVSFHSLSVNSEAFEGWGWDPHSQLLMSSFSLHPPNTLPRWYFHHQSTLNMWKHRLPKVTELGLACVGTRSCDVPLSFGEGAGKKLPDSSQVWGWLTSDPAACDFHAPSNLWGTAYSRCSLTVEVNCLKKGLECGGKRLQSWFWDQVTGGCRDGGWDRFPPPRHHPTPKHPWL